MSGHHDESLLRAHLDGDATAFEQLVNRYADELYGFLRRFVGDAAAADDLVQEAFLQVHQSAATFDLDRRFRPWLYTIAANKARDFMRSRGRRQEQSLDSAGSHKSDDAGMANVIPSEETGHEDEISSAEQNRMVRAVVDELPEGLRTVILLGYFQQLPYAEIAEVLGIPVGTVKSRLHTAVHLFGKRWRERTATA